MLHRRRTEHDNICTIVIIVIACSRVLGVDVISSSKLETCIKNGTQGADNTALSCRQKLVVVVSVDSGDSIPSQDVEFTLNCIGSPTGTCPCPCNYAEDVSCTCRDLSSSLTVSLSKGQLWASYPLTYLQSFNYQPTESVVRPPNGECKDGEYDANPTCSWYYLGGEKMVDSQGFVCYCTPGEIWDATFGQNTKKSRAGLDCDFFSGFIDNIIGKRACSGHCLMMDPHWYGGYSLGEASLQFEIEAQLTFSGNSSSEQLQLSPSTPVAVSSGRTLAAKLLGDLAGYTQLPVLSEKLLMIPHPRPDQSIDSVFANRSEWMLLDRSKISFDGTECDKVGTSFTAFRYQVDGCVRAPQSCLSNQLHDILDVDKALIASGKTPVYLVSRYSWGLDSNLRQFAGGPLSYALPVGGIRSSLVQLETEADSLKFVVNTSPGAILAARVCTFAEVKCGGFEASAARGYLHAWIANKGTLAAAYTLTVSNCSMNIRPMEAQRFALAAKQNGTISPFEIYVEDDKAVEQRYCWLTMLDSRGDVSDKKLVVFFTNATAYEEWPSGGLLSTGTGAGNQAVKHCSQVCKNRFDLLCAAKNRCWGNIGGFFGLMAGTILGAGLLFGAFKLGVFGMLMQLCGPLLSCCGGGSNSKKNSSGRKYKTRNNLLYEDSADGQRHRKQHEKSKSTMRESHGQRTTFDELFEQEHKWQQQQQQRGKSYSKAGVRSSSNACDMDEPYYSRSDSNSAANKHNSGGDGSNATQWITAAPWDESAAGGSGHIPAGRMKGTGIVQNSGVKAKASNRTSSSKADWRNEEEQEGDWQLQHVQHTHYDEGGSSDWSGLPPQRQAARPYTSAPGRPMRMSGNRPTSRRAPADSQLAKLVNTAHQASEYLDKYGSTSDNETATKYSPDRQRRGSSSTARRPGPENLTSGSWQQQVDQQHYGLQQPDRSMSAPGRLPRTARGSQGRNSHVAETFDSDMHSSTINGGRAYSRSYSDSELMEEEYARQSGSLRAEQKSPAMLLRSSRDSVRPADMGAATAAVAGKGQRRSSSQPAHSSRTAQQLPYEPGGGYQGSKFMLSAHLQQQQQYQQQQQGQAARNSSRAGRSSGLMQRRSGSIAQQQQQYGEDNSWQASGQVLAAHSALPEWSGNTSSPDIVQQWQRQQQTAANQQESGRNEHDNIDGRLFASYNDEAFLADADNSDGGCSQQEQVYDLPRQAQQAQQSSAHRQQHQQRTSAAAPGSPGVQKHTSSMQVQQQWLPQRLGPSPVGGNLSTAARPLHAPFTSGNNSSAAAFRGNQGVGTARAAPGHAIVEHYSASPAGRPVRARPSSIRSAAAAGSHNVATTAPARRGMSSEPGSGIGRHRPSQQQQQQLGAALPPQP